MEYVGLVPGHLQGMGSRDSTTLYSILAQSDSIMSLVPSNAMLVMSLISDTYLSRGSRTSILKAIRSSPSSLKELRVSTVPLWTNAVLDVVLAVVIDLKDPARMRALSARIGSVGITPSG